MYSIGEGVCGMWDENSSTEKKEELGILMQSFAPCISAFDPGLCVRTVHGGGRESKDYALHAELFSRHVSMLRVETRNDTTNRSPSPPAHCGVGIPSHMSTPARCNTPATGVLRNATHEKSESKSQGLMKLQGLMNRHCLFVATPLPRPSTCPHTICLMLLQLQLLLYFSCCLGTGQPLQSGADR
eukprot:360056-Chlamydomonas_euryale.AAC.7